MFLLWSSVLLPSLVSSELIPLSANTSNAIQQPVDERLQRVAMQQPAVTIQVEPYMGSSWRTELRINLPPSAHQPTSTVPRTLVGCHSPFHELPFPIPDNYRPSKQNKQEWLAVYDQLYAFVDLPYNDVTVPGVLTFSKEFPEGFFPRKLLAFDPSHRKVYYLKPPQPGTENWMLELSSDRLCAKEDTEPCMPGTWPRAVLGGPVPHYWQMNILRFDHLSTANAQLGLPYNHFSEIIFHNCHRDMFFNEEVKQVEAADGPIWYHPSNYNMWETLKTLIAPGGHFINTIFPSLWWGGEPMEESTWKPPQRYCAHHPTFGRAMCWGQVTGDVEQDYSHGAWQAANFDNTMRFLEDSHGWRLVGGIEMRDSPKYPQWKRFVTAFQLIPEGQNPEGFSIYHGLEGSSVGGPDHTY
ncbi:unnamed protein product [Vitrella brassicaformis CCMP3155]|uniref:Uncharacterized protein n=1 Tax=Vitrella brassicaformis (strain CCMP3155) TaxID=1169540 RepID=A0A0G4FPQ8_VITBC|nr:unnamed protein product [Vitrella brassicaformis CCMP3155]|mmetsp:Transcript_4333/g.9890  ORF Transcript_4333/g.9890 Transcript_4333/m.9890 type:complete len:411 (-) Transcript_4333:163-1395(-)|eukprot:CEM16442.1 unnamed protein product [Vitrella brassicaformis CCMP3155]